MVKLALLLAAIAALAGGAALSVVLSQGGGGIDDGAQVKIAARQLADGRVEFALEQDGELILPRSRFFPPDLEHSRWLKSSEVTVLPDMYCPVIHGDPNSACIWFVDDLQERVMDVYVVSRVQWRTEGVRVDLQAGGEEWLTAGRNKSRLLPQTPQHYASEEHPYGVSFLHNISTAELYIEEKFASPGFFLQCVPLPSPEQASVWGCYREEEAEQQQ